MALSPMHICSRCLTRAENGARVDKAVDKARARAMCQVRLAQLGPASAEQRLD
jgi:hypothetical protein